MKKISAALLGLAMLLSACAPTSGVANPNPLGSMFGSQRVSLPAEYATLQNPISSSSESITRGRQSYMLLCVSCHGETGEGDGIGADGLNPRPAALSATLRMRSDAYLFYRIAEGGNFDPYNSAMIAFKDVLREDQRWDLVNFLRTLGGFGMMQ